jgi:hypothetical protein
MLKRLTFLLLYLSLSAPFVWAQQLTGHLQKSEYFGMLNAATVNPDFMTDKYHKSVGLSTQHQWLLGLGNVSPTTQVLRGEWIMPDNRLIVGGYALHDRVGITTEIGGYFRAAYIVDIFGDDDVEKSGLSIGGNLGGVSWRIQPERLDPSVWDDPDLNNVRPSGYLDVGAGAFLYKQFRCADCDKTNHYLYAGISMPRTIDARGSSRIPERLPHLYGIVGYYRPSGNGFAEVSAWFRRVRHVPPQAVINVRWRIQQFATLGCGVTTDFKNKDQLLFTPEFAINIPTEWGNHYHNFRIGWSYMYGPFSSYFRGTHEVNLAWSFD